MRRNPNRIIQETAGPPIRTPHTAFIRRAPPSPTTWRGWVRSRLAVRRTTSRRVGWGGRRCEGGVHGRCYKKAALRWGERCRAEQHRGAARPGYFCRHRPRTHTPVANHLLGGGSTGSSITLHDT